MERTPNPLAFVPTTVALITIGSGGLVWLFTQTLPNLGPRWLFFFFLILAGTGIFLPITAFLNYRFPSDPAADGKVILRQAMWFGVVIAVMAWLQYGRVFTLGLAGLFFFGFLAIEVILRIWEGVRWTPQRRSRRRRDNHDG